MKARFFDKLDNKVFMIIVLTALATGVTVFAVTYRFFYAMVIDDMRSRTQIVNQYTESSIDPASFSVLNSREDADNPVYDEVGNLLNRVRRVANVRYLYTAKEQADGTLIYLIDGLDRHADDFRYIPHRTGSAARAAHLPGRGACGFRRHPPYGLGPHFQHLLAGPVRRRGYWGRDDGI